MAHSAGNPFTCPSCGKESVVERRSRMEGWDVVGMDLVCAICGAVIESAEAAEEESESVESTAPDPARHAALAFLGNEEEKGPDASVLDDAEPRRFCRDCRNYVQHPFGARCSVWDKLVEPMQDCDRFEPRE